MISYFTRHPNAANLMMAAAIFLGLSVVFSMERETFPEFAESKVSVQVIYRGSSAADVDEQVCQELDDALKSVDDLDEIECLSVDGRGTATLTMNEGADISQFYNDILSIASGLDDLPDTAEAPSVTILGRTELIAILAVSGIETTEGLIRYTDGLANRLGGLANVSDATVSGITENELKITFNQLALRRYGVSAKSVADALIARSLRQPLGTVSTLEREITLRYSDARRNIAELESLVILQNAKGGFVRLSDLATVSLVQEVPEVQSFINGRRAATIQVEKTKQDDAIDAFAQVQALITAEMEKYPDQFNIDVINNTTEVIQDRISLVVRNTMQGLALVLLVMCLFFSIKEAFWIALALPVSFLGGMFLMQVAGMSINMISLVALLMAVGLIMDDSIVIADNISKWRHKVSPREASVRGTSEVMPGVVSSFLTTACIFGPLMFLSGQIGSILQVVPVVLLITLAVSLVEAFLILPHHLSHVGDDPTANDRRFVPRNLDTLKEKFVIPATRFLMSWRYLTLGTVIASFIFTISLIASGTVKVIGFPSTEGDTIEARISLTSGIPQARTQSVVAQLIAAINEVDAALTPGTKAGKKLVERILVRYAANSDVKDNGTNTATITVDLLDSDERNVDADDVALAWRRAAGAIPDLIQSNFTQTSIGPGGVDLDVQVSSRNLVELEAATAEMARALLARNDVTEAFQDFTGGRPEARLRLNNYAYTVGLTPQFVASQLRAAFSGAETDSFREGFSNFTVRVELGDSVPTISDLEDFPIDLGRGKQIALSAIADIELTTTYPQITRENGEAIAKIIGKIDRSITTSKAISDVVVNQLGPVLAQKYPGISIGIGGATEEQQKTQSSILTALLTGLLGVYIILAFQFRSYVLPVVVMLSIPFALIGTVLGHMALGINLSMPSFIGFASLSGVVVNNAILFLSFFQSEIRDNDYLEAAIDAVRHRFRPVLLSSSTTIVGLLPILFETSRQAQVLVPLVVSVAFGLLASTILVIFVFPSALGVFFDFADVKKWLASRERATVGVPQTAPAAE